jgi:hypothetical protein
MANGVKAAASVVAIIWHRRNIRMAKTIGGGVATKSAAINENHLAA